LSGWLIALLATLGTLLFGVVKADLEDAKVCRWLARHLIYRAAERLPRGERARWREEAISDTLALPPGRLPPLLWALDVYRRSGSWAQTRGAPSRWEILVDRIRAAQEWLRSLPHAQTRSREESKQHHPSRNPDTAQEIMATAINGAEAVTMVSGQTSVFKSHALELAVAQADFEAWLRKQRQDFEAHIDQQVVEFRRYRDSVLLAP
jgi:hypothetical protein